MFILFKYNSVKRIIIWDRSFIFRRSNKKLAGVYVAKQMLQNMLQSVRNTKINI